MLLTNAMEFQLLVVARFEQPKQDIVFPASAMSLVIGPSLAQTTIELSHKLRLKTPLGAQARL